MPHTVATRQPPAHHQERRTHAACTKNQSDPSKMAPDSRSGRLFALSDRVRYYWTDPVVARAIAALFARIDSRPVSLGLLSQFAGQIDRDAEAATLSERLVRSRVGHLSTATVWLRATRVPNPSHSDLTTAIA